MHRYSGENPIPASAIYAWQLLGNSVYLDNPSGDRSIMNSRPGLNRQREVNIFLKYIK